MNTDSQLSLSSKHYRGISDKNCLVWCHGTVGLKHKKVRKYRYPLWKYAHVSHRVVVCICLNCNMQFHGESASGVPLSIPVTPYSSYFNHEIPVRAHGKIAALRGEIVRPFRHVTQEMLCDQTRLFIELIQ